MSLTDFKSEDLKSRVEALEGGVENYGKILFTNIATAGNEISINIPDASAYGCHLVCFDFTQAAVEKTVADVEIYVVNNEIHVGKNQGSRSFTVNSAKITNGKLVLNVSTGSNTNYGYAVVFS